jgi:omega-6 fatty acid desaturase (delta-12 desaturase)
MTATSSPVESNTESAVWKEVVAKCRESSPWRASWQLIDTLVPYAALWVLMSWSVGVSWWLTAALAVLAGMVLVRTFIIFHDCGHGSFFASSRANSFWGFFTGLLTFTPYHHWRGEHAIHHGSTGDLARRGVGDVWTMTVREYLDASRRTRLCYRVVRNPLVLLGIGPGVLFLWLHRFSRKGASARERRSVWITNLAVLAMAAGGAAIFGVVTYLILQVAVLAVAGAIGVWLFYLQHQFEDAYWESGADWDYTAAALKGSSFLRLPRVLQWFSGNIGYHHIHHLSPRIPNYNLERCHRSHPMFEAVPQMSLLAGIASLRLKLWDESSKKLVTFRHVKRQRCKLQQVRPRAKRNAKIAGN